MQAMLKNAKIIDFEERPSAGAKKEKKIKEQMGIKILPKIKLGHTAKFLFF